MNEAQTRAELIDPALKTAGWGVVDESRILREHHCRITLGRLQGAGQRSHPEIADYILVYRNTKLAVIEAKKRDLPVGEGVAQAKSYAAKLQVRFTYATNGREIYQIDMETGAEAPVSEFPSPQQLWNLTYTQENAWRDRFAAVPFEDKGGTYQARYYQDIAIQQALEAIANGQERILLTLATGTGKTFIAFQLAWKLFHSRWNISREPTRRPRVLFLADRNILADQAFNAFSAFAPDALVRIEPDQVRKKGAVPKNGSIFFTIFQTFMSGRNPDGTPAPYFGEYPQDFFDFIIIDECHRGGARDESTWRAILEYFTPATQLGLTATPLRKNNADTYAYFGDPVFKYSLKDGINDGFLTPFRVHQYSTTIDDYVYTPDDEIEEGEVEQGKLYEEKDFNKIIQIKEREEYRVRLMLAQLPSKDKAIVFCANQAHAALIRDLINQNKSVPDPLYCVRVTANDANIGNTYLRQFQDNDRTIPTVLTTSHKLSTGVDARNVRHIVLFRPINSMIEFKQIIGRGTRLYDGKDYFTIHDFVKAYRHFADDEWDGEPLPPEPTVPPTEDDPTPPLPPSEPPTTEDPQPPSTKPMAKVTLADGKERQIQHMMTTSFWDADGTPISAGQFLERLFGDLPNFFADENQLREIWSHPETRQRLLDGLAERGYTQQQLEDTRKLINAEASDIFDVLAYIAFALPTETREHRVLAHRDLIFSHYDDTQQAFLDFVLSQYIHHGVADLEPDKLPRFLQIRYGGVHDAVAQLGPVSAIRNVFIGFQRYLFLKTAA